jgi:hypothetical protein
MRRQGVLQRYEDLWCSRLQPTTSAMGSDADHPAVGRWSPLLGRREIQRTPGRPRQTIIRRYGNLFRLVAGAEGCDSARKKKLGAPSRVRARMDLDLLQLTNLDRAALAAYCRAYGSRKIAGCGRHACPKSRARHCRERERSACNSERGAATRSTRMNGGGRSGGGRTGRMQPGRPGGRKPGLHLCRLCLAAGVRPPRKGTVRRKVAAQLQRLGNRWMPFVWRRVLTALVRTGATRGG